VQLQFGSLLSTASVVQNRLADAGDAVLVLMLGSAEAGACCADNGNICKCDYTACLDPNGPIGIPWAYDCTCHCNPTNGSCQNCQSV
jgi:hypothetical protein